MTLYDNNLYIYLYSLYGIHAYECVSLDRIIDMSESDT